MLMWGMSASTESKISHDSKPHEKKSMHTCNNMYTVITTCIQEYGTYICGVGFLPLQINLVDVDVEMCL